MNPSTVSHQCDLLIAQWRGDLVPPEPGADARQVVLIDERQTVGLKQDKVKNTVDSLHCRGLLHT